jgi:hypothetical protein
MNKTESKKLLIGMNYYNYFFSKADCVLKNCIDPKQIKYIILQTTPNSPS